MKTCTQEGVTPSQPGVSVSVTSSNGRHVLNVSRHYDGLPNEWGGVGRRKPCDHDGREFASSEAASAFALDRGYTRPFFFPEQRARRLENPALQRAMRERALAFIAAGPGRSYRLSNDDKSMALIYGVGR